MREALTTEARPALTVDGLSKQFRVPHERVHTLKERALHPLRRSGEERFEALRDVSFTVASGEFFGIVGRNGSGKSTLLKCMAGIYRADAGDIYVNGRVSTFIELGVGFNPDLAARDNVILNAIMLGLSPAEARARFEDVIRFAELEEFVDLKLKNYSSGMHVRLAFSVMIQVNAEILLIDEVLAVGDASFQQKCWDEFARMRDEKRTIVLVTHDMGAVRHFCDRAMLLERGEMVSIGDPDEVGTQYLELNFGREAGDGEGGGERAGDGTAEVLDTWFEDEHGERRGAIPRGRPCSVKTLVKFHRAIDEPKVAVGLENDRHALVFVTSTEWAEQRTGSFAAGEQVVVSVTFDNVLAPGRYHVSPTVVRGGSTEILDRRSRMSSVVVTGTVSSGGLVDLPHDLRVERAVVSAEAVTS